MEGDVAFGGGALKGFGKLLGPDSSRLSRAWGGAGSGLRGPPRVQPPTRAALHRTAAGPSPPGSCSIPRPTRGDAFGPPGHLSWDEEIK